jgi:hypothetical protein
MATRTAVARAVTQIRGDDNNIGSETSAFKVKNYFIEFDNGGVVVTTGSDTLNLAMDTAINTFTRNGKTVTVRDVTLCQCLFDSAANSGAGFSYSGTHTLSTNTLVLTITGGAANDWSTGATLAAAAVVQRPFGVIVTVNEV